MLAKNSTIYIITDTQFCNRDYKRFGVKTFMSHGHKVVVLDITPISRDYRFMSYTPDDVIRKSNNDVFNYCLLSNVDEIFKVFKDIDTASIFILHCGTNKFSRIVYKLIYQKRSMVVLPVLGAMPVVNKKYSKKIIDIIRSPSMIPNKIMHRYYKYHIDKIANRCNTLVIYGGSATKNRNRLPNSKYWQYFNIHSYDYDKYLEDEKTQEGKVINGDYFVYIDENLESHPDNYDSGSVLYSNKLYLSELNNFFDSIEFYSRKPVVVAAHPRCNVNQDCFIDRRIIKHKTSLLIKYSSGVLIHGSTAISFAVLYKKPCIFLVSTNFIDYYNSSILNLSRAIGGMVFNMSTLRKNNIKLNLSINKDLYNDYVSSYVKHNNSINESIWEAFINRVKTF